MSRPLRILRFWKTQVQQDLKMYPLHFSNPGVLQTQGIQAGSQFHLIRRLAEGFNVFLRELICAICASVQHLPPYYPSLIKLTKVYNIIFLFWEITHDCKIFFKRTYWLISLIGWELELSAFFSDSKIRLWI